MWFAFCLHLKGEDSVRKRVLAMVLAGLMMFETGNVAIASEIKGNPKI